MSYTIAQLKQLIADRQTELSEAKVYFDNALCKKKVDFEAYLDYLKSLVIPVISEPEAYVKPSILETINYVVSNGATITQCTENTVTFTCRNTIYKIEIANTNIKLWQLETYREFNKLSDIDIFITAEYQPVYVDPYAEIEKHNKKKENEILEYGSSDPIVIRSINKLKNIYTNNSSYYQLFKDEQLNGYQDISFWLRRCYVDASTEDKQNTILEYLTIELDDYDINKKTLDKLVSYYKNLNCSIEKIDDDLGFTKIQIKPIFYFDNYFLLSLLLSLKINTFLDCKLMQSIATKKTNKLRIDRDKLSIPWIMKFFKSGINPDLYLPQSLQCPKCIALSVILKDSDKTIVNASNSDIASLIRLHISKQSNPIIHAVKYVNDPLTNKPKLESIPYRVYDAFSIHDACMSTTAIKVKSQVRMVSHEYQNVQKLPTRNVNKSAYTNNRHYTNIKDNQLSHRVALSKLMLLESLSDFNNCMIYFEPIDHSYKKNHAGHKVLPEQLKMYLDKIHVGTNKCLGKIILFRPDKVQEIGILVVKKSKIFYFQLPKHLQKVEFKKVGNVFKVESFVDVRMSLDDKKQLKQKIDVYYDMSIKDQMMRLDKPEIIQLDNNYDNYVIGYLRKHGLSHNLPVFTTELNINWSKILNMSLDHQFIDKKLSTPVTIK